MKYLDTEKHNKKTIFELEGRLINLKKIIKEYDNGVTLIYRVNRGLVDYFVQKEFKNTVIIEGITQEDFINRNEVYEKIVGSKCEAEVTKVQVIERQEMSDTELYRKLFGINTTV